MNIQGSINVKSIATVGLRVNEGLNVQTLMEDTVLTKYSRKYQYYYVINDRTVTLPDATTLPAGWAVFVFSKKDSKGTVFVRDAAGEVQYRVKPRKSVNLILLDNTSAAGVWRVIESGAGGVGSRNVVITSPGDVFTTSGGTVTVNPFVATISNGFEDDGTPIEDIIEFVDGHTLTVPTTFPYTTYVYMDLEGEILEEAFRQQGGNDFPENPEAGIIFYNLQKRKNYKYTTDILDYPCVAVGEVTWTSATQAHAITYPFNYWFWDNKHGDVRNTVIKAVDSIQYSGSAGTNTAKVGNLIATVADGYDSTGLPLDYTYELPYYQDITTSPSGTYIYADKYGTVFTSTYRQDGALSLPSDLTNWPEGAIFFSINDGRNYRVENGAWAPFPCVAIGEIVNNTVTVYECNVWWWHYREIEPLVSHVEYFKTTELTTQIILSEECIDKNYLVVNIENTLLLSDTYDLSSDGKTISFINAIEAGMDIEVRWYIPLSAVSVESTGANKDLSNLSAVGEQKLIPMNGNVGDVVVRSENGVKWAAPTGMTIGTVFMSDLVAPNNPAGALEYIGVEVTSASATYPEFWENWLKQGRFATGTYAEYEAALTANNGTCPFFAFDEANNKFKTPTWADGVFAAAASTSGEVNKYYVDQFQGHHHNFNYELSTHKYADGTLDEVTATPNSVQTNLVGDAITDGVNGTPRVGSETYPKHVRKRWFVQVANAVETTAYQNIDSALLSKVNKAGDTMTGQLVMNATSGGIKLGDSTTNAIIAYSSEHLNLVEEKTGKGIYLDSTQDMKPFYWDGTKSYPLISPESVVRFPDVSAKVDITAALTAGGYQAPTAGWICAISKWTGHSTDSYIPFRLQSGGIYFVSDAWAARDGRDGYGQSSAYFPVRANEYVTLDAPTPGVVLGYFMPFI